MTWVAGWNQPACLPDDEPAQFTSWRDAHAYLHREVADRYMERAMQTGIRWSDYTRAARLVDTAEQDRPMSAFFDGLVWWIADLPDSGSSEPG